MDFKELETFVSIVEKGSISAAAAALGVSQPAVSKRVARIEAEMGASMFANGHKHSTLTSEGAVLYKAALKMLDTRKKARIQIAEISQELYGTVRISASSIPGDFILPEVLVEFMEKHPGVSVQVTQGDSQSALEDLSDKKVDLAVIGSDRNLPGFTSVPFYHDELVLIVNRNHPLAARKYIPMEEIGGLKLVGRTSCIVGCMTPDGMRRSTVLLPFTTIVWPALLPPLKRTTPSTLEVSQSTILPLPSSPHWAPTTTTFFAIFFS